MQNNAPQAYQAMHKYVSDMINSGESNGFKERFDYHKNVNGYNDYVATEEIVAELAESLFGKKSSIDSMVKNNPKMVQSVLDGIKSTKAKIKDKFLAPNTNRTGLKQTYAQLDKFEQMYNNALREAVGNKGNVNSGEVKYAKKADDVEATSIKMQIKNNLNIINQLEPVAIYQYSLGQTKEQVKKSVLDEFKKFGYAIDRQGFGVVEIEEKQINRSLDYLNTEAEKAAFFAVPRVLKRGISINDRESHKDRGYDTVTFAAPVEINGVTGVVAVVVKKTKGNRYKTHRILMPDGSAFDFSSKKAEVTSDSATNKNIGGNLSITSANSNISQPNPVVKTSGRSSLAGEHAKTANFEELQKAMAMDEKGIDAQTIWKQTGWGKGQDGLWRFEIDDSEAEYIGPDFEGLHHSFKLSEVLKHDKLYEAYPELKNLPVGIGSSKAGLIDGNGSYAPISNLIFLDKDLSNEEKREVLLHEAQHAIQVIENFAVGADYKEDGAEKYWRSAGELEARDVKARADMTMKERRNTFPESMEKYTGLEVIQWRDHPDYEMKQEIEARIKAEKEKQRQKRRERSQQKKLENAQNDNGIKMDDATGRRRFVPRIRPIDKQAEPDRIRFVPRLNAPEQKTDTDRVRFVSKLGNTEERYAIKESAEDSGRRKFVPRKRDTIDKSAGSGIIEVDKESLKNTLVKLLMKQIISMFVNGIMQMLLIFQIK